MIPWVAQCLKKILVKPLSKQFEKFEILEAKLNSFEFRIALSAFSRTFKPNTTLKYKHLHLESTLPHLVFHQISQRIALLSLQIIRALSDPRFHEDYLTQSCHQRSEWAQIAFMISSLASNAQCENLRIFLSLRLKWILIKTTQKINGFEILKKSFYFALRWLEVKS